ncbi:hypothetical protein JRB27_25625 [Rhodococcus sp. Rp3]|nr:hypothetical protein [Rhodococcus sp. Rp3]
MHSRYRRQPADTIIGAYPVILDLVVRRFFCDDDSCNATTFAQQVPGLTQRWARRTTVLDTMIEAIGLAVDDGCTACTQCTHRDPRALQVTRPDRGGRASQEGSC